MFEFSMCGESSEVRGNFQSTRGFLLTTQAAAAAASRETRATMGVYRLTIPETIHESLKPDACQGSSSFKSQRQRFLTEDSYSAQPTPKPNPFFEAPLVVPSSTSLEAPPDLEHFSELDDGSTSSVFSSSSTCTSHTSSDNDSLLMELVSRTSSLDGVFFGAPKRHSTACCADGAFRREQRKRQVSEESNVVDGQQRDTGLAMALSHSFLRELEREDDRVDRSLALWEDTESDRQPRRKVANVHTALHSWDMIASSGFRRSKKENSATAAFLNGLFSGFNFSTSRRSRKSSS